MHGLITGSRRGVAFGSRRRGAGLANGLPLRIAQIARFEQGGSLDQVQRLLRRDIALRILKPLPRRFAIGQAFDQRGGLSWTVL